ncbi:MAG: 4-hydroxyphenylpyruvate dioxygenase [Pseudobdellovibrionaceae bacterium]
MAINPANPTGLSGVNFIEFTGPSATLFQSLFENFGFKKVSQLDSGISLWRQGNVNFILNSAPNTFASEFHKLHGPAICSTGFVFEDANAAFQEALKRGARAYEGSDSTKGATPVPAIYGIGDSLIYFLDKNSLETLYAKTFKVPVSDNSHFGKGMTAVDHFTNNVPRGEMQKWCDFYSNLFNFREARYFDIKGLKTGLFSKVMRSPCGTFSVPINEPADGKSQIQEYLEEYHGSGIQHLALLTDDICPSVESLAKNNVNFLTPPPTSYYEMLPDRVPNVKEDRARLQKSAILVDGDEHGYLLQIFTKNIIGPIFFEVIQRKGHDGFGDGNFQALFDAIERDQIERGYLQA